MDTAQRRLEVRELYVDEGLTYAEIAARFGVSAQTIAVDLRRAGVTPRRAGARRGVHVSREAEVRRDRVVALAEGGLTRVAIALELGVSERLVGKDMQRRGVRPRPQGRPALYPQPEARPCRHCGRTFRPNHPSFAARGGAYCSAGCQIEGRAKHPAVDERDCERAGCSRRFTPTRFEVARGRGRFCSPTCSALHRWEHAFDDFANLAPLVRQGWPGRARQRWLGKLGGRRSGKLGGRPRVPLSPAQVIEARALAQLGWGRRAIASRLRVSERAVRNVIEAPA